MPTREGLLTRGVNGCQGVSTDLGQLADGMATTVCDGKRFDNKRGDTGNKGCDNKGCATCYK